MTTSSIVLPTIGLTLIFAVFRYLNFALMAHATLGAYAGFVANTTLGLPILPSLITAFVVAGIIGYTSDRYILRSLRASGTVTTAIGSIALTIGIENLLRFGFGNTLQGYSLPMRRDWWFEGVRIAPQQVENLIIGLIAVVLLFGFLTYTRAGKAMRAVADNRPLADIKGVNANRVYGWTSFLAMGLGGLGGMLLGMDTAVDPLLGYRTMVSVFAAAVLGGLGSMPGALVGALIIGLCEELSLLVLPPSYRSVIGLLTIFIILIVRPQGLLGRRT